LGFLECMQIDHLATLVPKQRKGFTWKTDKLTQMSVANNLQF
jgi:hypothetical protein